MPGAARKPRYFTGEHAYGVDSQRRIALPAAWHGGDDDERTFMLYPHELPCIHMMPRRMFDKLAPRLEEELLRNPQAVVLLGSLLGGSAEVTVDKQGRFALGQTLMTHAGITDRVLLVGNAITIALWAPEVWAARRESAAKASQVIAQAAARPEALGQAIQNAMGVPAQA